MKSLDPIAPFAWLAGILVGTASAQIIGPWLMVITLCTSTAFVSLGRREPNQKPTGVLYILSVNAIAIGCTSILSWLVASQIDAIEERTLYAPVALAIGYIGLDWPKVLPYLWDKYREWRTGGKLNGQ